MEAEVSACRIEPLLLRLISPEVSTWPHRHVLTSGVELKHVTCGQVLRAGVELKHVIGSSSTIKGKDRD